MRGAARIGNPDQQRGFDVAPQPRAAQSISQHSTLQPLPVIAHLDAQQLSLALEPEAAAPAVPPVAPAITAGGATAVASDSPQRTRRVALGNEQLAYRLRRARRRTIGFQIDDNGLTVSAPRWVTVREIEGAIAEKQRWIRGKLEQWRAWRARRRLDQVRFTEQGVLPYLGGQITLRLRAEVETTRAISSERGLELHLALPADASELQVKDAVQSWLQAQARRVLGERLTTLAAGRAMQPAAWSLSSARSQWGSCTQDGRIRLNWRLVHFALPVIDYVVAHELAHLQELNHGPRFWRTVAMLLPGFEAARDEIKDFDIAALPL